MTSEDQRRQSLSAELAKFVTSVQFEQLSEPVIEMAQLCVLDWVGSTLAGSRELPGKIIFDLVKEAGGNPQATLLVNGQKSSILNAALVNGAMSHIVELDDVHKASILHPAAPVIPAALAAAELAGKSGKDFLLGIILGYEVAIRIGEAVTPSHYRYWHTTATCGTFGAAAAAGKILGLTAGEMIHALGTAGTQASGLWEFIENGAMSKHLHPGKAAENGLMAALLAKKGFTGALKILEGNRGFFKATAEEADSTKVTGNLGVNYKIMETSFKIHASCRHTHPVIDLVTQWKQQYGIPAEQVERIKVATYQIALDITGNYHPQSLYAAKFSLPFCTALAAVKGSAGLVDFNEAVLKDELIRSVMDKVELAVPGDLQELYPEQWPARIEIETKDGQAFQLQTNCPKGDPENMVSPGELVAKFRRLAQPQLEASKTEALVGAVLSLAEIRDLNEFTSLFANQN